MRNVKKRPRGMDGREEGPLHKLMLLPGRAQGHGRRQNSKTDEKFADSVKPTHPYFGGCLTSQQR